MPRPRIVSLRPADNYTLLLGYNSGETRLFDVKPYIKGSWFGQLNDIAYFRTVHILPDGDGIEWPNGQDIAPHELYDLSHVVQ
jgi:hypothetical protein